MKPYKEYDCTGIKIGPKIFKIISIQLEFSRKATKNKFTNKTLNDYGKNTRRKWLERNIPE